MILHVQIAYLPDTCFFTSAPCAAAIASAFDRTMDSAPVKQILFPAKIIFDFLFVGGAEEGAGGEGGEGEAEAGAGVDLRAFLFFLGTTHTEKNVRHEC